MLIIIIILCYAISYRALGPGMQFQHKLHIVYLINDILHHCQRKGAQDLQKALEDVVVPVFFSTQLDESPENRQKVTKVLGIWENHNLFEPSLLQVNLQLRYLTLLALNDLINTHYLVCHKPVARKVKCADHYNHQLPCEN